MKTLKTLFAAALMLAAATSANAQSVSYPRFHLGLRAGFSVNKIHYDIDNDNKSLIWPQGGIAFDFRLAPIPLYFESGLYYVNKGEKQVVTYSYIDDWGRPYQTEGPESRWDNHHVYVPLLLSWHQYIGDKFAIQPFVGATVGYLTDSEEFESALRVGCGFNFGRLYMNLGYDFGLTKHDAINFYTNSFGFSSIQNQKSYNGTFFMTLGVNIIGASR